MISLDDLCGLLDGIGVEWANESFGGDEKPAPPYITLEAGYDDAVYADNVAWDSWMSYEIVLHAPRRDYALEGKVAGALDAAGCAYEKSINPDGGERLVEASFAVNVRE